MRTYDIAIVGVGGQGILTLGSIIGIACTLARKDVAIAEVHGMSQRGGSVIVHVRIGREPSPIIPVGSADHIMALELLEAARYIHYARRGAIVTVNDFLWPPPLSKHPTREALLSALRSKPVELHVVDANKLSAEYTGSILSANVALLGFSLGVDRSFREIIPVDYIEKALEKVFTGRALEANTRLLRISYEEGLKRGGSR